MNCSGILILAEGRTGDAFSHGGRSFYVPTVFVDGGAHPVHVQKSAIMPTL